jgi:outer membrane protein TolC
MNALPSGVVRLRPDVAAAEQQLIAQNAMVGKAVAELYPDVSISGLWGYASRGGRKLIRADSQTYNYAPLVTLPFLDWNKLKNNVRLQEYMREETYYNYKQTVLNALTEIKNAMTAYQNALNGSKHKYQALQNMRTTMRLAQNKYDNGLSEFSDILTTQQNLITAQEDYTASRAEVLQNLIAYYKAVAAPINSN